MIPLGWHSYSSHRMGLEGTLSDSCLIEPELDPKYVIE